MSRAMMMAVLMAACAVQGGRAQEKKSWTDSVRLGGDLRYRLQVADEDGKDSQPRVRHRVRARIGLNAKIATITEMLRL